MIEVKVLIENFKDKENKQLGLLQPGFKYPITKERAKYLSEKGIVEIIKPKKDENAGT